MKVIKENRQQRSVTLRIDEEIMLKLDKISEKNEVSRQKLIEAILKKAIEDKNFIIKLKD